MDSTAGEVRFDGTALYGDVDGDGVEDFQINLPGVANVEESDLIL